MGMSVGVVTIKYLDEPHPPISDFLQELKFDPFLGEQDFEYEDEEEFDGEHYTWGGGSCGDGVVEFSRHYLAWRANKWADSEGVGPEGNAALHSWIADLPWNDDYITLHLGA